MNEQKAGMDCGTATDCEAHKKATGWHPAEDKTILAAYAVDASVNAISNYLHRSQDAVRNRAYKLKAQRPTEKKEQEPEMPVYGICINCGESVLLHWAKDLTETEKNQLATTLCECHERAVLVETSGTCRFCNQMDVFTCLSSLTQTEKDELATCNCNCDKAKKYVRQKEQVENAKDRIGQLFGEFAEDSGFKPIGKPKILELMGILVGLLAQGEMNTVTIEISASVKAKISRSAKGGINVERIDTRKCKLEEQGA